MTRTASVLPQALILLCLQHGCASDDSKLDSDASPPLNATAGMGVAAASTPENEAEPWLPLPASAGPYGGRSLEQWAVEWARWSYAQTDCVKTPTSDPDGVYCALYQDEMSPVFLLQSGEPGTHRTSCKVPAGKAIFVPVVSFYTDNAGVPAEDVLTEQGLKSQAAAVMASIREVTLRVDGTSVWGLESEAVGPVAFAYDLPPEPNAYSCAGLTVGSGRVEPAYLVGVFALFPPPPAGMHSLTYSGAYSYDRTTVVQFADTAFSVE